MRKGAAAALAGGAVLGAALLARRWGPEPAHPEIALWYASLRKPRFTPPGTIVGAVWTSLDALLAVAGARILAAPSGPRRGLFLLAWAVTVAGLPGWMATFFGRRAIRGGVAVIGAMAAATLAAIGVAIRMDRVAALLLAPLVGWLGFAGVLNGTIARLNR